MTKSGSNSLGPPKIAPYIESVEKTKSEEERAKSEPIPLTISRKTLFHTKSMIDEDVQSLLTTLDSNIVTGLNPALLKSAVKPLGKQNSTVKKVLNSKFNNFNAASVSANSLTKEEIKKLTVEAEHKIEEEASLKHTHFPTISSSPRETMNRIASMNKLGGSSSSIGASPRSDGAKKRKMSMLQSFHQAMQASVVPISVLAEDEQHDEDHPDVLKRRMLIHPYSYYRRYWDMCTSFFVIFVCFTLPVTFSFGWVSFASLDNFEYFLNVYFAIDIILNFFTGFVHKGQCIMDKKKIRAHYLESWFIIDLLGTIPFEEIGYLFISSTSVQNGPGLGARKALKILKYFKLPKLLRISRMIKLARQWGKFFATFSIVCGFIIFTHFFTCGCVWLVAPCDSVFAVTIDGKIETIDYDPVLLNFCSSPGDLFLDVYFSVNSLMLGIQTMDIPGHFFPYVDALPYTKGGQYYAGTMFYLYLMEVIGTVFTTLLIANCVLLVTSKLSSSWSFRLKMERISRDMDYYNVPEKLQIKVKKYYDYLWLNQKHISDSVLLNDQDLSDELKSALALHLYKDLIRKVPFFYDGSDNLLGRICRHLKLQVYLPEDFIIRKGDVGRELFIISKGEVSILGSDNGEEVARLLAGSFFGEIALLEKASRRTGTVKAVSICEINILSQESFHIICLEYPEFEQKMIELTLQRKKYDLVAPNKTVFKARASGIADMPDAIGEEDDEDEESSFMDEENVTLNSQHKLVKKKDKQSPQASVISNPEDTKTASLEQKIDSLSFQVKELKSLMLKLLSNDKA